METVADILWRAAQALAPAGRLPPLFFVTDPARTPDPVTIAERLPRGCGVIYRAFGATGALVTARRLAGVAEDCGLTLLIGLDAVLAEEAGAHGVHLPERFRSAAPALRRRHPDWILTGAAHSHAAVAAAAQAGFDAVLLSPVFPSRSPSAGEPLGLEAFSRMVRGAGLPVYALGGVNTQNVETLHGSGASGIAVVGALVDLP
jgi:thiamine-phosphate pyrophosphorylase